MDAFAPARATATATALPATSRARLHDISRALLLLAVGRRTCATRSTSAANLQPGHAARRAGAAHGPDGRRGDPRPRAGRAARADARPLHCSTSAPAPTARRPCCAASPTCRRARASGTRVGGTRAVAEGLAKLAGELGVELRTGVRGAGIDSRTARVVRRGHRRRRARRLRRRRLQHGRRPHLPRAGRRQGRRALRAARATSRPARASCSTSG